MSSVALLIVIFFKSFQLFYYNHGRRCCNTCAENKIMDIRGERTQKKELPQREGCPNYHQRMRLVELVFLLQYVVKKMKPYSEIILNLLIIISCVTIKFTDHEKQNTTASFKYGALVFSGYPT